MPASSTTSTPYDVVAYTSYPYPRTHPDRMHALAGLFGLQALPPARCRVLELGCASGGNLLPMAAHLPGAEFVGLDLSVRQIEQGRAVLAETGLTNVRLEHADILDVNASWGRFDYVICHGVYSWVPPAVQAKILEICRDHLTPTGVGYVSYNVYPGWHMREMVRHMMRYHVAQFAEPRERIGQARALMDFLAGHVEHKHGPYALLLAQELQLLQRTGDDYLFHEHLEEVNTPIYFHQFAERLTAHRLQYLCETDVHTMVTDGLPDEVTATLGRITRDIVSMEQYLDFVRNRQFRATLVCHDHAVLRRNLGADSVMSLRFGLAPAGDATPVDLSPDHAQPFVTADGRTITVATPITKAALLVLRTAWPRTLEFGALHERASVLLGETGTASTNDPQVRRSLASDLLACLLRAGLEVRSFEPPIATVPGPKPRVSSVTAALARRSGFATNAHHRRVDLDPIAVELLQHLDGNHGHPELVEVLMGAVERGALRLDAPAESPSALRATLGGILDRTLADLVRHALLVLV